MNSDELVREVSDCNTIGDAFSSGLLIAWPTTFVSYFVPFNILQSYSCTFNHQIYFSILFYRFERKIELPLTVPGWIKEEIKFEDLLISVIVYIDRLKHARSNIILEDVFL
jgi:hypothetical protein